MSFSSSFSSISLRRMLAAAVPGWIVAVCLSGAAVPSLAWAAAPGPLEAAEQRAFQQAAELGKRVPLKTRMPAARRRGSWWAAKAGLLPVLLRSQTGPPA
jgi:hypothetical protein